MLLSMGMEENFRCAMIDGRFSDSLEGRFRNDAEVDDAAFDGDGGKFSMRDDRWTLRTRFQK